VDNEVLVAELLVREGWSQPVPPKSRSRWRVIAVMVAVVLGCGAAAILVKLGSPVEQQAQPTERISIIEMPERTDGAAGADTSLDPESSSGAPGGIGAGTHVAQPRTSDDPSSTTSSVGKTSATMSRSTSGRTSSTDTSTTGPAATASPPSSPSQSPTTTRSACFLLIFC
jgi:hypothetical protein